MKLPAAKHVPTLEEKIVCQWFSQNVRFLLSGSAVRDRNFPVLDKRMKVMIFHCTVFCLRGKFLQSSHGNTRLIILLHFANKRQRLHMDREEGVNFFQKRIKGITSQRDCERATYSALTVLREISVCRQLTQYMGQLAYMIT